MATLITYKSFSMINFLIYAVLGVGFRAGGHRPEGQKFSKRIYRSMQLLIILCCGTKSDRTV